MSTSTMSGTVMAVCLVSSWMSWMLSVAGVEGAVLMPKVAMFLSMVLRALQSSYVWSASG